VPTSDILSPGISVVFFTGISWVVTKGEELRDELPKKLLHVHWGGVPDELHIKEYLCRMQ